MIKCQSISLYFGLKGYESVSKLKALLVVAISSSFIIKVFSSDRLRIDAASTAKVHRLLTVSLVVLLRRDS